MEGNACIQVTTAAPSAEDAERLAGALVERRLAACVQVVPGARSVYRWQGRIERAEEWLLMIKTEAWRYEALERAVRELHPYETPELLAVEVAAGSGAYLRWIGESVHGE